MPQWRLPGGLHLLHRRPRLLRRLPQGTPRRLPHPRRVLPRSGPLCRRRRPSPHAVPPSIRRRFSFLWCWPSCCAAVPTVS